MVRKDFIATIKINNKEFPFSGTAVSSQYSIKSAYNNIVTGNQFRAVTSKPITFPSINSGFITFSRALKKPTIRINFEDMTAESLQLLKNLQDSNQMFEIQLLAFDALYTSGVPLRPISNINSVIDPPTFTQDSVETSEQVGSTLARYGTYGYRVVAVTSEDDGGNVISSTRPSETVYVGLDLIRDIDGNEIGYENNIALSWRHIEGVIRYKVYGRTPNQEKLLNGNITAPTNTIGELITFTDDGSLVEQSEDTTGGIYFWMGAGEYRWSDDPTQMRLFVNGINTPFSVVDHNNNIIQTSGDCYVYTKYGVIEFNNSLQPTDQVYLRYIWEPKVTIEEIDPQPRPSKPVPLYTSTKPSWSITPEGYKQDNTYQGMVSGTLYAPSITLFVHEF